MDSKAARNRLLLRLGARTHALMSGAQLHDALQALGLSRYNVEEMADFVEQLAKYINLTFPDAPDNFARQVTGAERHRGEPSWTWPQEDVCVVSFASPTMARAISPDKSHELSVEINGPPLACDVVPVKALQEVFLQDEAGITRRKIFDARAFKQFQAMREILLAGDTNRLVAELTFVRINDLAAPPEEESHPLAFMEHVITFIIIANAICLSMMADPEYEDWAGWDYVELFFASFLLLEILVRMYIEGIYTYWRGKEKVWNMFDILLATVSWVDVFISQENSELFSASFLRVCRLIRLVRVMRVFRLKVFKELRLMVKGLLAGLWTLSIAFILLFSVLYMVSGFAKVVIGSDERTIELGLGPQFRTIPDTMFTFFRCFTGDCNADDGRPMASLLAQKFGTFFVICFVVSYMLVAMGIFNVILAVYVDITMKAAKETEAMNAEQHARESIRIARTTRELLKKFAAFQKSFTDGTIISEPSGNRPSVAFTDEDINDALSISKECFLMVVQDRSVQKLMDELDLPPDRANLFEIIDADGSGTLHVSELVHGLLKIRGDIKKSDTVAPLLATKAVQQMVQEMGEENRAHMERLETALMQELDSMKSQLTGSGPMRPLVGVGRTAHV